MRACGGIPGPSIRISPDLQLGLRVCELVFIWKTGERLGLSTVVTKLGFRTLTIDTLQGKMSQVLFSSPRGLRACADLGAQTSVPEKALYAFIKEQLQVVHKDISPGLGDQFRTQWQPSHDPHSSLEGPLTISGHSTECLSFPRMTPSQTFVPKNTSFIKQYIHNLEHDPKIQIYISTLFNKKIYNIIFPLQREHR